MCNAHLGSREERIRKLKNGEWIANNITFYKYLFFFCPVEGGP